MSIPSAFPFLSCHYDGRMKPTVFFAFSTACLLSASCSPTAIDRTDRSVHRLVENRQQAALGTTSDAHIGGETGEIHRTGSMYDFTPRPVDSSVPASFQAPSPPAQAEPAPPEQSPQQDPAAPPVVAAPPATVGEAASPSIFSPDDAARLTVFSLPDALGYAMKHARDLQDAKEELYLAALDLTLERHLWTPQFVYSVRSEFADYGQVRDFDRAMTAVSDLAVSQRLPYGGEVTARVVNTLMRDLGAHVTSGEPGNFILDANIPLFRGAGKVAFESRYQEERNLIYAVRTFENFRRLFVVQVAGDYFELQGFKAAIANAYKSYQNRRDDWRKAEFIDEVGRSRNVFDATRALSSFRSAEAQLVSTKEVYASALDRFKISIGMPVEAHLDVVDQEDDRDADSLAQLLSDVSEETAIAVALRGRLDFLNSADRVDDAKRGVLIAKNRILPDLELTGSTTMDTDPEHLNSTSYNSERVTWRGAVELRMDDRKTERNAYRATLVGLRAAERAHDQFTDTVRAEVRRAFRRIAQQSNLLAIQAANVEENELRLDAARAQFDLGRNTNRDVVDADNDLLDARNDYARAVAAYRNAILEFRRDTGTLRVADNGLWDTATDQGPEG